MKNERQNDTLILLGRTYEAPTFGERTWKAPTSRERTWKAPPSGERTCQDATLWGAHLQGAWLVEAHLEGAILQEAHLEGANLGGAVGLTREMLAKAFGDAATKVADEFRPESWPAADKPPDAPDNAK